MDLRIPLVSLLSVTNLLLLLFKKVREGPLFEEGRGGGALARYYGLRGDRLLEHARLS